MNENKGMNSAPTQEGAVPQSQAPSADCVVGGGVSLLPPRQRNMSYDLDMLLRSKEGWEDITEELRETSSGMKIGTMIHGPDFSLYEAMSALELMDPKMDPGMAISPEDVKKQKDDKSSKAVSKDMKLVDLQEDEIIAIMDRCISYYTAWCNGQTMCHTILTCRYAFPSGFNNNKMPQVLRTFILGLLKLCKEVRDIIMKADIYEEEDFMVNATYKPNLADDFHDMQIMKMLEVMMHTTEAAAKSAKEGSKEAQLKQGINSRLRFIRSLWLLHKSFRDRDVTNGKIFISELEKILKVIRSTQKLAAAVTPGFDVNISRTLIPHHPPRVVHPPNAIQTTLHFLTLLKHFKRMVIIKDGIARLDDALGYYKGVSAVERPAIVARSHLLLMLGSEKQFMGKGPVVDAIRDSFRRFCPTFELCDQDSDMQFFMSQCAKPMCLVVRLSCENRARQRRKIGKLLADWHILMQNALVLDRRAHEAMLKAGIPISAPGVVPGLPAKHPCFSYCFDQTCGLLTHYLELGFELELFSTRELGYCYWYLEYLFNVRLQQKSVVQRQMDTKWQKKFDALVRQCRKDNKGGASGEGSKKGKRRRGKKSSSAPASANTLIMEAKKEIARGVYTTIQALQKNGALKFNELPFGSEELTFQHRFKEFSKVQTPAMLSYAQYKDLKLKELPSRTLLGMAYKGFESAKIIIAAATSRVSVVPSDLLQCQQLLKVAKGNSLSLMWIQKIINSPPPGNPKQKTNQELLGHEISFDFSVQKSYPLIKLLKKKKKNNKKKK